MSTSQVATSQSAKYAARIRKKPKQKNKNETSEPPVKSNPSKRHRDRLNTELERLSQLIPLPEDVVNKLDKLSILRLSVAYLRNKSYSKHIELEEQDSAKALLPVNRGQAQASTEVSESELALQALDGFIMVVTQNFNVFYITSTVHDCLGFPQSDVINQPMLCLIHAEDRKLFMKQMLLNPMGEGPDDPPEDGDPPVPPDYVRHGLTPEMVKQLSQDGLLHRSFICRLRCLHDTSSGFLALHFTGHLGLVPGQNRHQKDGTPMPPELGLFLLASPLQTPSILEIRTKNYIFRTKHKLDYTPLGIDQKGRIVLGYTEAELRQQSGYQFIHSADMMHCADAHTKLMRKGQSGLTVFRLLHRANRWQWVTASARLIFNKGVPDYIISTHRPITEQEGEEHLKKRSIAFRFDFTGHASLYATVNPIGAGPPPSNNNRSQNVGQAPGAKRARITEQEIDPATLFGAQTLQSMDNYPEGLPNVKPTTEPLVNHNDQTVKAESRYGNAADMGYFKQSPQSSMGSNSPYDVNGERINKMESPKSDHATDSGFSDVGYLSPASNDFLDVLTQSPEFQQQSDTNTSANFAPSYKNTQPPQQNYQYQQQQGTMYNQGNWVPNQTANQVQPMQNYGHENQLPANQNWVQNYNQQGVVAPSRPLQHQSGMMNGGHISIQNGGTSHHSPQYTNQMGQMNRHPGTMYSNHSPPVRQQGYQAPPGGYHQNQYPNHHMAQPRNQAIMHQQQNNHQAPKRNYQGDSASQRLLDQIQRPQNQMMNGHQDRRATTSRPKDNVSVLNSVEISSTTTAAGNDHGHKELQDILSMLGPDQGSTEQFEMSLECQEHTIQFDMDKIAAEFQTADPMGVVQNYVQNNPTDAMALAAGNMPEMRRGGNTINQAYSMPPPNQSHPAQYPSYQYDQSRMQNKIMNQGYVQQQQGAPQHPIQQGMPHPQAPMKQMPPVARNVKNEGLPDDLAGFNLDDFLTYDVPNIQG